MALSAQSKTDHAAIITAINTFFTNMPGTAADANQYAVRAFWAKVLREVSTVQSDVAR